MASTTLLLLSPNPTHKTLATATATATATARSAINPSRRLRLAVTRASYNRTPATDRLVSAVSYTLPFLNSIQYGRFLFQQYPRLGLAVEPILPLVSAYRSVPYATLVALFVLYVGVVRNPRWFTRFARFNAMQALSLDVLLMVVLAFQRIFVPSRTVLVYGYNAVFVVWAVCFVYGFVYSVLGRTPYLPFLSEAASQQL